MKKLLFVLGVLSLLFACSKENKEDKETEKLCPVIAATLVPQIVKDSFAVRYPSVIVNTWFQKDDGGYSAYFIQSVSQKKLAEFSATGVFLSEKTDIDQDDKFEDSTATSNPKFPAPCECEIPHNHHD